MQSYHENQVNQENHGSDNGISSYSKKFTVKH